MLKSKHHFNQISLSIRLGNINEAAHKILKNWNQSWADMSTLTCVFLPSAWDHFHALGYPLQPVVHCILLKPELFSILSILSAVRLLKVYTWRILVCFSILHIMRKSLGQTAASSTQCKLSLQFFLPEMSQTDVDGIVFTAGTDSRR